METKIYGFHGKEIRTGVRQGLVGPVELTKRYNEMSDPDVSEGAYPSYPSCGPQEGIGWGIQRRTVLLKK